MVHLVYQYTGTLVHWNTGRRYTGAHTLVHYEHTVVGDVLTTWPVAPSGGAFSSPSSTTHVPVDFSSSMLWTRSQMGSEQMRLGGRGSRSEVQRIRNRNHLRGISCTSLVAPGMTGPSRAEEGVSRDVPVDG